MTRSGVLVVDKPSGLSSFQVVAAVRRAFGTRSVGHAGTLDPMATGVLVVMVGQATKLSNYLTLEDKGYQAEITFGRSTDTLDRLGETTDSRDLDEDWLEADALEQALELERTRREQIPPSFSAIKVDGRRAYALSRRGNAPELPPRPVQVRQLTLLHRTPFCATFDVDVTKGYYIRSLARDLGSHLGVPAHLSALRRTKSGSFALAEAVALPLTGEEPMLSLSQAAERCMAIRTLTPNGVEKARVGKLLQAEDFRDPPSDEQYFAWLSEDGLELIAVGAWSDTKQGYRVLRGFN